MKLAEALSRRAELVRKVQELKARALDSARHQEGDEPAEDPRQLLAEADAALDEFQRLIAAINRTNLTVQVDPGRTVTDLLAERDALRLRHSLRSELATAASRDRFALTRSEIRMVASVDVRALRAEADGVAQQLRALDLRLQETNWNSEID
jgi:hypothetical protein